MELILLFVILVCILKIVVSNYYYKELKEYNRNIERELIDCKKKIHEHQNELIMVKESNKSEDEMINYLINENDEDGCINLYNISSPRMKIFLKNKIDILKELNCEIEIYVQSELSILEDYKIAIKDERDLFVVLGVILDNMIDACKDSSLKLVSIVVIKDGDLIKSSFANYLENEIDINKIWNDNYTSKGMGHGLGLSYVKDVVKNNKRIMVNTELVDDFFVQNVYFNFN